VAKSRVEVELSLGLGSLGFVLLPSAVMDEAGNLVFPASFEPPASWAQTSAALSQVPDWIDFLACVRRFTFQHEANEYWRCWKTAVRFHREEGEIHLALVKSTPIGVESQRPLDWARRFHDEMLVGKLQQFAGRRPTISPSLLNTLSGLLDLTKGQVEGHPGWNRDSWPDLDPSAPDAASVIAERKAGLLRGKWYALLAIEVASRFVQLLKSWTTKGLVRAAILWYDPNQGSTAWGVANRFAPLNHTYNSYNARTIHYWWSSAPRQGSAYKVVPLAWGPNVHWRYNVTDVPFDPNQFLNETYPDARWAYAAPEAAKMNADAEEERRARAEARWEAAEARRQQREEALARGAFRALESPILAYGDVPPLEPPRRFTFDPALVPPDDPCNAPVTRFEEAPDE